MSLPRPVSQAESPSLGWAHGRHFNFFVSFFVRLATTLIVYWNQNDVSHTNAFPYLLGTWPLSLFPPCDRFFNFSCLNKSSPTTSKPDHTICYGVKFKEMVLNSLQQPCIMFINLFLLWHTWHLWFINKSCRNVKVQMSFRIQCQKTVNHTTTFHLTFNKVSWNIVYETDWFPKPPIRAMTAYGVHDATYKKQIVMAALAILISADWLCCCWLLRSDSTFIFFA